MLRLTVSHRCPYAKKLDIQFVSDYIQPNGSTTKWFRIVHRTEANMSDIPSDRKERRAMTKQMSGTREEWLVARLELLDAEKELTRRSDELARRRQELPWVRIDKEYRFETDEGEASLADLFRGRSQLLVYHFMLGPDDTAGCPSCSAIADGFNGFAVHLANHDVTLAAVARAARAK